MKDLSRVLNGLKPAMLMVLVETAFATKQETKADLEGAFLRLSFWGSLFQNLFYEALALTSATFVSALFDLVPAITFIMAICCGFERLNLGVAAGKAKVLGTVMGIGGAMLLTFVKGPEIHIWSFHINLLHQNAAVQAPLPSDSDQHRLIGVLCAVASCFSYALWLIIQAKMSAEYPSHLSSTALMSAMGAIQGTVFALCIEGSDWSQWKLGWDVRLLAVSFSGIVASGIMFVVIAWCVRMKGPLFASVFNPLMLVFVAFASPLMLNENLYLGSVVGALLIVCGLYIVLWEEVTLGLDYSDFEAQSVSKLAVFFLNITAIPKAQRSTRASGRQGSSGASVFEAATSTRLPSSISVKLNRTRLRRTPNCSGRCISNWDTDIRFSELIIKPQRMRQRFLQRNTLLLQDKGIATLPNGPTNHRN
ncbi:WAT1-related protein [Senna tora]|uniref:WAT1-related protein n=1 Tax=Senna tora TaxID=362788 RepID=A0A834SHI5_9FABA|nr:WAT1-related protein [Senna tora]